MTTKKREYSQAQNKATQKYIKSAYDEIKIRVPKGERELFQQMAKASGVSLNAMVYEFLSGRLQKMQQEVNKK